MVSRGIGIVVPDEYCPGMIVPLAVAVPIQSVPEGSVGYAWRRMKKIIGLRRLIETDVHDSPTIDRTPAARRNWREGRGAVAGWASLRHNARRQGGTEKTDE